MTKYNAHAGGQTSEPLSTPTRLVECPCCSAKFTDPDAVVYHSLALIQKIRRRLDPFSSRALKESEDEAVDSIAVPKLTLLLLDGDAELLSQFIESIPRDGRFEGASSCVGLPRF